MLIIYHNTTETLITTDRGEEKLLKEYFGPNNRDLDDYDRYVTPETNVVEITNRLHIDCNQKL